jgi:ABC-type branched-subunit amino acid transport system substrate-binding protein
METSWMHKLGVGLGAMALAGAVSAAGVTDTEIVLGTHLDLSGPVAAGMPMIRNGMQMRIDEANEAGGVHGRKLRLIVEDNASQPAQAVRAVQKLVRKDEVFAIINSFGSGPNAAGVKAAVDAGVVYFAPWAASAAIHGASGKSPLVFTTVPNYDSTIAIGLSWGLKNWGSKRVGVIYQEGPFGDLLRRGIKQALDAYSLQPAAEASYKPGDIDFSSQVQRMRAANTDLVVLATITRETIGVMTEVKKLGWSDVRVLTSMPGRTQIVAALGKDAVEGLYGVGGWRLHYADSANDAVKRFIESYRKRFNAAPDENSMNAYSYTDWFIKGLQAAGRNLTAEAFAKSITGVPQEDFMTYRRVSFQGNHIGPEVVEIDQLKGGRWTAVSPQMTEMVR